PFDGGQSNACGRFSQMLRGKRIVLPLCGHLLTAPHSDVEAPPEWHQIDELDPRSTDSTFSHNVCRILIVSTRDMLPVSILPTGFVHLFPNGPSLRSCCGGFSFYDGRSLAGCIVGDDRRTKIRGMARGSGPPLESVHSALAVPSLDHRRGIHDLGR